MKYIYITMYDRCLTENWAGLAKVGFISMLLFVELNGGVLRLVWRVGD